MIYTLIISLLIEKPFHLLSPQSFSFQTVSEFIDILVNSPTLCLLTPCSVPRGGFLYTMIVPGEGFCSLQVVSRRFVPGGMVMDEIDICITQINTTGWYDVA